MIWPRMALLFACLLGAAFFAGMETGVISINRLRLRHRLRQGDRRAARLQTFLDDPNKLLGTTLVGTNLCHITFAILLAGMATRWLGPAGKTVAGFVSGLVLLVFSEYLPKSWFCSRPAARVLPLIDLLQAASTVLSPAGRAITWLAMRVFPVKGPGRRGHTVTREELLHLARETHQTGHLTPAEHAMLTGVFSLQGRTLGDIMVRRAHMLVLPHTATIGELLDLARAREISRVPIYHNGHRRFIGAVSVLEVLRNAGTPQDPILPFLHPPQFAADTLPAELLLPRMRVTREPFILVANSSDEVVGLVTVNEIVNLVVDQRHLAPLDANAPAPPVSARNDAG